MDDQGLGVGWCFDMRIPTRAALKLSKSSSARPRWEGQGKSNQFSNLQVEWVLKMFPVGSKDFKSFWKFHRNLLTWPKSHGWSTIHIFACCLQSQDYRFASRKSYSPRLHMLLAFHLPLTSHSAIFGQYFGICFRDFRKVNGRSLPKILQRRSSGSGRCDIWCLLLSLALASSWALDNWCWLGPMKSESSERKHCYGTLCCSWRCKFTLPGMGMNGNIKKMGERKTWWFFETSHNSSHSSRCEILQGTALTSASRLWLGTSVGHSFLPSK